MISLYQVIWLLLAVVPIAGMIGWVGGRQVGRLSMMIELTKNNMLKRKVEEVEFAEWFVSHDGSSCVDLEFDNKKLFSFALKEDGQVAWAMLADDLRLHGPSIDTEEFREAFFRWAEVPFGYDGNIVFEDDGAMAVAGMKLKLINTDRGEVALVNDRGTPLMAIWPKGSPHA